MFLRPHRQVTPMVVEDGSLYRPADAYIVLALF